MKNTKTIRSDTRSTHFYTTENQIHSMYNSYPSHQSRSELAQRSLHILCNYTDTLSLVLNFVCSAAKTEQWSLFKSQFCSHCADSIISSLNTHIEHCKIPIKSQIRKEERKHNRLWNLLEIIKYIWSITSSKHFWF